VALLMFARVATRERELVVRTALGASRRRIVSQLFAEALVLGVLAASLGLPAASLGLHWGLGEVYGESRPFWVVGGLSPATTFYAGLLTIVAAVVTGVVPALKATGRRTGPRLRQATAGGGGLRMGGIWTGMIVAQVATTVAFTAVAYLVHRQAVELTPQAMGFQPEQYLAVEIGVESGTPVVTAGDTSFEALRQRYAAMTDELVRRLAADPGVASVTVADGIPLLDQRVGVVEVDGEADPTPGVAEVEYTDPSRPRYFIMTTSVAIDFFDVFRAPVLSGRALDSPDLAQHANTVIVNQSFVDRLFGGRNPVGRRIRYGVAPGEQPGPWYEIVGVVRNLVLDRTNSLVLDQEVRAQVYHPLSPGRVDYPLHLAVRAGGDPDALAPSIRRIAAEVNPALRLDIRNLERARIEDARFWKFCSDVILLVTVIALFLALAGIYSVMSFTVSQRTREIGIRVALGARASSIVAEIFRRPLRLVAAGVTSGCALVAALMVFLLGVVGLGESVVPAQAAALFLAFGLAVLVVCALACIGPTRRALRVQPAVALNAEV
jgi:predicted permease